MKLKRFTALIIALSMIFSLSSGFQLRAAEPAKPEAVAATEDILVHTVGSGQ